MPRYVISPGVALYLAGTETAVAGEHQLLAPTLLRSQTLSLLYRAVQEGQLSKRDAERQLGFIRSLRVRLLGDRAVQQVAWRIADQLGWPDTLDAEYLALTQLQADAFITLDPVLARAAEGVVPVASVEALA